MFLIYFDAVFSLPGTNSKSISVLGKSKFKSYFVSQYWASLNPSLTSLASHSQDLDVFATCHDVCITFYALYRGP